MDQTNSIFYLLILFVFIAVAIILAAAFILLCVFLLVYLGIRRQSAEADKIIPVDITKQSFLEKLQNLRGSFPNKPKNFERISQLDRSQKVKYNIRKLTQFYNEVILKESSSDESIALVSYYDSNSRSALMLLDYGLDILEIRLEQNSFTIFENDKPSYYLENNKLYNFSDNHIATIIMDNSLKIFSMSGWTHKIVDNINSEIATFRQSLNIEKNLVRNFRGYDLIFKTNDSEKKKTALIIYIIYSLNIFDFIFSPNRIVKNKNY